MQIVKEQFQIKGFSKEGIVKKYKRDNKIKEVEARKIVEETLLENT